MLAGYIISHTHTHTPRHSGEIVDFPC